MKMFTENSPKFPNSDDWLWIPKKTKINEDGSIDAYISIGVYQNDYTKNVDLIKSIVAHEIVHALKYAKTFNKKNRSRILNKVRGEVLPTISKVNNEYIEEFLKMFYLSLQDEIQAKVQEVGVYLQSLKSLSTEEIINKVSTLKFTTDAVKMKNYKPNKILSMDNETIKYFIKKFNETIKSENIDMVKIKTPSDPKLFFDYWTKIINNSGEQLFRKIMKAISNREELYKSIENSSIYKK